jgi:photosystem II stability/assembly factor-like uncharacterized protein
VSHKVILPSRLKSEGTMKRSVMLVLFLVAGIIQFTMAQGPLSTSHTGDVWVHQLGISKAFIDVHAFSPTVVLALTNEGGIFKTTNGGINWAPIDTVSCEVRDLVVLDDQKALLSGWNNTMTMIFRTTNGGTKWDTVFTQPGGHINTVCMVDANNGMAFGQSPITTATEFVALRTTNGGLTWASILNPPPSHVTQEPPCPRSLVAFGSTHMWFLPNNSARILRSTDGGSSWLNEPETFDGPPPPQPSLQPIHRIQ